MHKDATSPVIAIAALALIAVASGTVAASFGPPAHSLCGSCGLDNVQAGPDGFGRINLGVPVDGWFPVDFNGDGIWELAIAIAGTSPSVGVYDPLRQIWLDGPRPFGNFGIDWGVGDWNHDGYIEYAYLSGKSVHYMDTRTGSDRRLWVADFVPLGMYVYGADENGAPTVCMWTVPPPDWTNYFRIFHKFYVYTLFDQKEVTESRGGPSRPVLVYADQAAGESWLFVHDASWGTYFVYGSPFTPRSDYYQKVKAFGPDWGMRFLMELPGDSNKSTIVNDLWRVERLAAYRPEGSADVVMLWLAEAALDKEGAPSCPRLFGSRSWAAPVYNWAYKFAPAGRYVSIGVRDVDGDGRDDVILPLSDGSGWEIRDLVNGKAHGTIPEMPAADLHSGPIFVAHQSDLFYVADSTLYVWLGRNPIPQPNHDVAAPTQPASILAYPNPFNAETQLSWDASIQPSALEIFNILGQRVRSYDFRSDAGATFSVVWDGKDEQGQISPSGMYFARLQSNMRTAIAKMVLLK